MEEFNIHLYSRYNKLKGNFNKHVGFQKWFKRQDRVCSHELLRQVSPKCWSSECKGSNLDLGTTRKDLSMSDREKEHGMITVQLNKHKKKKKRNRNAWNLKEISLALLSIDPDLLFLNCPPSKAGPWDWFSKPGAYITHSATWPLSDITGVRLCAASSGAPKGFIILFPTYSRLLKTCEHTLSWMCKTGGVTL